MKLFYLVLLFLFACQKQNPEDPFLPKFKHMNDRLKGEWELNSIFIDGQDSSNFLFIDTINIVQFLKFEPTIYESDLVGKGNVLIKSKNMTNYPEKIGISQSTIGDFSDTNLAIAKINYHFREGSKEGKDFFVFNFHEIVPIVNFSPETPVFLPINKSLILNNFYIKPFIKMKIQKATNKELILEYAKQLQENSSITGYKRYRLIFLKI